MLSRPPLRKPSGAGDDRYDDPVLRDPERRRKCRSHTGSASRASAAGCKNQFETLQMVIQSFRAGRFCMNNSTWKSDPRLHSMDAAKIALLASFADELANTPENERMRAFLNLNQKLQKESISFSADERTSL